MTVVFVAFLVVLVAPMVIDFAAHVSRYRTRRGEDYGEDGPTWAEDWKASR